MHWLYVRVYDLPTVSLRFFMVYGPRQPRSGAYAIVTGVFAGQKERGEKLTIEGEFQSRSVLGTYQNFPSSRRFYNG